MAWIAVGVMVSVLLALGWLVARRQGRNSGSATARDVDSVNHTNADAHGYTAQHHANHHWGGLGF